MGEQEVANLRGHGLARHLPFAHYLLMLQTSPHYLLIVKIIFNTADLLVFLCPFRLSAEYHPVLL